MANYQSTYTGTQIDEAIGKAGTATQGSTGSTDNALLRADGTGGATVQGSAATIDDNGNLTLTGATETVNNPILSATQTWNGAAITTTGASGTGTTATITFAEQAKAFPVGSTIVVGGNLTPTGYRGTFVVTASTTTSVSYANTTTANQTVAGTVQQLFSGMQFNVTDTASAAGGSLLDLQVGGSSKFKVSKASIVSIYGTSAQGGGGAQLELRRGDGYLWSSWGVSSFGVEFSNANGDRVCGWRYSARDFNISGALSFNTSIYNESGDLLLYRDAAQTLAQRNGTNAQTFRIYQSYTDASNYTRGALSAASATVKLAAESAGTGAADIDIELTPKGTGRVKFGTLTTLGTETVTGYIEIKDSGGTVRKLAVVS